MALLSTQQLQVSIGDTQVCAGLDWSLESGQCWGILGRNGVGKTTLLHTLAGLRPAQQGHIQLNHTSIDTLSRRSIAQQLGMTLD